MRTNKYQSPSPSSSIRNPRSTKLKISSLCCPLFIPQRSYMCRPTPKSPKDSKPPSAPLLNEMEVKYKHFWDWFTSSVVPHCAQHPDAEPAYFDCIYDKLQDVCPGLSYEIIANMKRPGERELVVSAEGEVELFPVVAGLHKACPVGLERKGWKVTAFRKRAHILPGEELKAGDVTLTPAHFECAIRSTLKKNDEDRKYDLIIRVSGGKLRPTFHIQNMFFILLCTALGEYCAATTFAQFFFVYDFMAGEEVVTLDQLWKVVDRMEGKKDK